MGDYIMDKKYIVCTAGSPPELQEVLNNTPKCVEESNSYYVRDILVGSSVDPDLHFRRREYTVIWELNDPKV